MTGNCKNCKHWEQDTNKDAYGLGYELESFAKWKGVPGSSYGGCTAAGDMMYPSYDGGCQGELLTHADFGCNQFEQREIAELGAA